MLIFILFIAMLAISILGAQFNMAILPNLVALAGLTGLVFMYLHNPDNKEGKLNEWLGSLSAQQKKQWYGLFVLSILFGLALGSLWVSEMGV